jgi:hypothetical protein
VNLSTPTKSTANVSVDNIVKYLYLLCIDEFFKKYTTKPTRRRMNTVRLFERYKPNIGIKQYTTSLNFLEAVLLISSK